MADFKLDRFKYRWRGNWTSQLSYIKDDVVYYEGKAFVCLQEHTSAQSFYTDFESAGLETLTVTVNTDTLNDQQTGKFYINGIESPVLNLVKGRTYDIVQNNSSNLNNILLLSIVNDGTLEGGTDFSNGVIYLINTVPVTKENYISNFASATDRRIRFTVPTNIPNKIFYYSNNNKNLGNIFKTKQDSNWELMFDGRIWKNNWLPNVFYLAGSIVKFKGYLYIAITNHTSTSDTNTGLIADIANWEVYFVGNNWTNVWTTSTYYDLGDIVRYNGNVYVCNVKHQSAETVNSGLEVNQSNWTLISQTDNWTYDWEVSKRYIVNDIVKYGANTYRCINNHTSAATSILGLEDNLLDWEIVVSGIEYKGTWEPSQQYKLNDVVKYGGALWKTNVGHSSNTIFRNDNLKWDIWVPGVEYEALWNALEEYQKGDIVVYGGYSYVALENNVNSVPSVNGIVQNTGDWELLTTGYLLRGDWGNSTNYKTGDVIRQGGYLYVAIDDNIGVQPDSDELIWKLLVSGSNIRKEWVNTQTYFIGDIALVNGTAYSCIARHQSSTVNSKPDIDVAKPIPEYWKILVLGSDNNVLSNRGDIKTYDSDNVKLPISSAGKVLKTMLDMPSWQDFEKIAKIYYVSVEGFDQEGFGTQLSAPFRTVKYACDYILADEENRAPATIFIKTGIYEEILPISIPKNVALVGDELRSTVIMPATGYELSNMLYVRNGSGIRNMTLQGLSGTLGEPNQYLTRRPNAGAFVSLDPGTGPADESVWITTRSPYVQNVSTFGTGCVGMKIDGNLHNGGNKSVVANDFTQIISDGIGYWAINRGRSELVSVFTYYCYIGYLAEDGGILRGTNGNNSYGTFGSVAEGVDETEVPITGTINNRNSEAIVSEIFTFGTNEQQIIAVGYDHAGQSYTDASISFNGSGFGATGSFVEYRNNAISELRIIDPGDSSVSGGLNYIFAVNSAQSGTEGQITLSQADTGLASEYLGQRIVIISGKGVGQYGYISSYNSSTKVAIISRDTDDSNGWDHFQPGWPIETTLDSTTRYAIEPRVTSQEPAFTTTANLLPVTPSSLWRHIKYGEGKWVAVTEGPSEVFTIYSANGTNWSSPVSLGTSVFISDLVYTGSKFLVVRERTAADGTVNTILQSADGETWDFVSLGTSNKWSSISANTSGNVVLVASSESSQVLISSNHGDTWSSASIGSTGKNWGPSAYGNGKFVILDTNTGSVAYSTNNGSSWTVVSPLTTRVWTSLTYGNGRFVAIANSFTAYSFDGITWYESSVGIENLSRVSYGAGVFLATGTGNRIAKSADGKIWKITNEDSSAYATTVAGNWENSAYSDGKWVLVQKGSNVINIINTGANSVIRAKVEGSRIKKFVIYDPGSNYTNSPVISIFDNNNTREVAFAPRLNSGVLAQPEMSNRGTGYITATATILGDGFADIYQTGNILNIENISLIPGPGSNLSINGIGDVEYRITRVESATGVGPYTLQLRISPAIGLAESPDHGTNIVIRERYSQIRLTGHDFLDIGTGNVNDTNYPNLYISEQNLVNARQSFNETIEKGGGRVFFTSTDQDGNFKVGNLFKVEQNTGIVTIDAEQFDLSGLEELVIGGIQVGATPVVIKEFSKDPTFVANSNSVIPTQRAIASFVASRISGGGANATTNTVVSGQIRITSNEISTTSELQINISTKLNMKKGIDGHYLAMQFYAAGGVFDSLS
jgi:hypothetical protein